MANTTKTPTTVKNEVRADVFARMFEIFATAYGETNVHRIGDSEIAVCVATAPTGEPVFATFSPKVKDYCDRKTNTKTIKAFDLTAEITAYENKCSERAETAKANAEKKKAKIARDTALREKRKAEREAALSSKKA